MFPSVVILFLFTAALALCSILAIWCGYDSRDGFGDQAHCPSRRSW